MFHLLKRWRWMPGLLCASCLMIGCGQQAGDLDDDGTSEVIEETAPTPVGPSTDMGDMPADIGTPPATPTPGTPTPGAPDANAEDAMVTEPGAGATTTDVAPDGSDTAAPTPPVISTPKEAPDEAKKDDADTTKDDNP